ncbi:MAG TPA: transglycosylase SLT domain-containing protein [Myxococcota bacterium]|nr:transglycosylase SLT domain-containing protein [Myxococcota bacterium]
MRVAVCVGALAPGGAATAAARVDKVATPPLGPSLLDARARKLDGALEEAAAMAAEILATPARRKDQPAAALLLGRIRYEQGRYAEAAAALGRATAGPLAATAQFYLGESLFWAGRHADARLALQKIVDKFPTSPWVPRARLRIADALLAEGRYAAAVAAYQDLLARFPRHPRRDELTFALAQALEGKGARAAAADAWRAVWVRWPMSPLAALAANELDRLESAGLAGVAASDGERLERARNLRWLRAHEACEHELAALADDVDARARTVGPGRGLSTALGHPLPADAAAHAGPESAAAAAAAELAWTVAFERALNRLGAGDVEAAVRALEGLVPTAPASAEKYAREVLAGAKARAGDLGLLADAYEKRVAEAKTPYGKRLARLEAARFYLEHSEYAAMRRHVEPLAKDSPKGGEVAWMLAWAAFREGRFAAARGAFADYCAARRWDTERCGYWTARAAERGGARADAVAGYQALVLRAPFSYYALMARSRLGALGVAIPPLGTADALAALVTPEAGADDADADPDGAVSAAAGGGAGAPAGDDDPGAASGASLVPSPAAASGAGGGAGAAELADLLGALGHGDEAYGAMGGRPAPADDAAFAAAAAKYGGAVPGLGRAYELWRIGFIADARDELMGVYMSLSLSRGWGLPLSVTRRGWTGESSAVASSSGGGAGGGAAPADPEAVADEAPAMPPAGSASASASASGSASGSGSASASGSGSAAGSRSGSVSASAIASPLPVASPGAGAGGGAVVAPPKLSAVTAAAGAPVSPVKPAAAAAAAPALSPDRVGPVDAKFVPTLGRLFAAVGDVYHSRRLMGPLPVATAEDRLMRMFPRAYAPTVERAAAAHDLDPAVIWAVMHTESAFHPYVVSRAGARGLMQVMPRTGTLIARALGKRDFDVDTLFDAELSIEFGAWYLEELIEKFHGQLVVALAAYNGGPRAVERWLDAKRHSAPEVDEFVEEIPWLQSREYGKKVLAKVAIYRYLYGGARSFAVTCSLDTHCDTNIDF